MRRSRRGRAARAGCGRRPPGRPLLARIGVHTTSARSDCLAAAASGRDRNDGRRRSAAARDVDRLRSRARAPHSGRRVEELPAAGPDRDAGQLRALDGTDEPPARATVHDHAVAAHQRRRQHGIREESALARRVRENLLAEALSEDGGEDESAGGEDRAGREHEGPEEGHGPEEAGRAVRPLRHRAGIGARGAGIERGPAGSSRQEAQAASPLGKPE